MEVKEQLIGLNPKCLEIVRSKGKEALVGHLKDHQMMVAERDFFEYFKGDLIYPNLYANIDKESSLNEIVSGDIVILGDGELWPRDLRFFLEESEPWHVALIYDRAKNMQFENEGELEEYLKQSSGKTYRDARKKGFKVAMGMGMLDKLYEHYCRFLDFYLEGAVVRDENGNLRDNQEVREEELEHCLTVYRGFGGKI